MGATPFMRAKVGTMANVGTGRASRSPGSQNARTIESMRSSEPQPVVNAAIGTPYAANAAFNPSAKTPG